jgi:hypothetical protein
MVAFRRVIFSLAFVRIALAQFPSLLDATIDDIRRGLEAGAFTSVDLVAVRIPESGRSFFALLANNCRRRTWLASLKSTMSFAW